VTSNIAGQGAAKPLEGKIALITGAGRRLGRAVAMALGEEGAGIVAHDRETLEAETAKLCDELVGCGAKSWKIIADLEKPEEYESLIGRAIQAAGSIDILVNNASIFLPNTLTNVGFGDVVRHIHVNAWTPFVLSREFARLAGRGKIVNILDTKISGIDPEHVAYILSKKMLATLTRMCALEYAPEITVNGVSPGLILPPPGKNEGYLQQLAQTVPLKRHGGPEAIIDAVLFLLKSDFITGQIIFVDGGRHLREEGHGPDTDQ
jgi:pteridine reductase